MVDVLIHLVIVLLIAGVIWWAVNALLPIIPLPAPIVQVVRVLLIVIIAIMVIMSLVPLLHLGGRSFY